MTEQPPRLDPPRSPRRSPTWTAIAIGVAVLAAGCGRGGDAPRPATASPHATSPIGPATTETGAVPDASVTDGSPQRTGEPVPVAAGPGGSTGTPGAAAQPKATGPAIQARPSAATASPPAAKAGPTSDADLAGIDSDLADIDTQLSDADRDIATQEGDF